jgi:hypothetical protein
VGTAFLEGEEACLVRPGKVALACRGHLEEESCPGEGEAFQASGAFRACRKVGVGHLAIVSSVVTGDRWGGRRTYRLGMRMVVVDGRRGFDRAWGWMRIGLLRHRMM